jgi:hypothetical protein
VPADGERRGEALEQALHLAVDDHGVEPLLAPEVLVDDRLGDVGADGDLLDGGGLVPALGEQLAADVEQLLPPLRAGHPHPGAGGGRRSVAGRGPRGGHRPIVPRGATGSVPPGGAS